MVAQKVIQLVERRRKVGVADTVDHIEALVRMQMMEVQRVARAFLWLWADASSLSPAFAGPPATNTIAATTAAAAHLPKRSLIRISPGV